MPNAFWRATLSMKHGNVEPYVSALQPTGGAPFPGRRGAAVLWSEALTRTVGKKLTVGAPAPSYIGGPRGMATYDWPRHPPTHIPTIKDKIAPNYSRALAVYTVVDTVVDTKQSLTACRDGDPYSLFLIVVHYS